MPERIIPQEVLDELGADQAQHEKPISDLIETNAELARFFADVENGSATDGGIQRYVEKWNANFVSLAGAYTEKTWESPHGIKVTMKLDTEGHSELIWSKR